MQVYDQKPTTKNKNKSDTFYVFLYENMDSIWHLISCFVSKKSNVLPRKSAYYLYGFWESFSAKKINKVLWLLQKRRKIKLIFLQSKGNQPNQTI